nr:ribosomal protein L16 [Pleonosporium sp.]
MNSLKKNHNNFSLKFLTKKQSLKFGKYGIKIFDSAKFTKTKTEALIFSLCRKIKFFEQKKKIKFWNLLYFNQTVSSLNLESRMGKGKGSITDLSVFLQKGTILFEFDNLTDQKMSKIFNFLQSKIQTRILIIKKILN